MAITTRMRTATQSAQAALAETSRKARKRYRSVLVALVVLALPLGFVVLVLRTLAFGWGFALTFLGLVFLAMAWLLRADDDGAVSWRRIENVGLSTSFGLVLVIGAAVWVRLDDDRASTWGFPVVYLIVAAAVWVLLGRESGEITRSARITLGLTVGPFLFAWMALSLADLAMDYARVLFDRDGLRAEQASEELKRRAVRLAEWERSGKPVIALTLSGGGYRAAVGHAGLLSVFDQAGIPVRYLSTVSGGSIAGAVYAMGWRPEVFRDLLADRRPGLAGDLLNLFRFGWILLSPHEGSGDIYAAHLRRVYFGNRKYDDTGPPVLIVNTTDLQHGVRQTFWPGKKGSAGRAVPPPAGRGTKPWLASVVAASGAFPVFFDPVHIDGGLHADGGVLENLGVTGLRAYSTHTREAGASAGPPPDIVIISNFSAELRLLPERRGRRSPLEIGAHAQDVIYAQLHDHIFRRLTNNDGWRSGGPYGLAMAEVWNTNREMKTQVFILGPRSNDAYPRFYDCPRPSQPCDRAVKEHSLDLMYGVSELDTLAELDAHAVRAAYWVGRRLAHSYLDEICSEIRRLRRGDGRSMPRSPCAAVELEDPPPLSEHLRVLARARQR